MKEILIIFVAIFLAELGDKTQIATMAFASKYGFLKAFLGSIVALALVNLLGAIIGDKLGSVLPTELIQKASGVLFVIVGILMLVGKF